MTNAEIKERVISTIKAELGLKKIISKSDSLTDDLGADSLDYVEIVMALEEEFEIEMTDDDWCKCLTVNDAINCVSKYVNPPARGTTMTNAEKIIKYLRKRKDATYPEISKATGIPEPSVRRTVGRYIYGCEVWHQGPRKCRVTGKVRGAYALA